MDFGLWTLDFGHYGMRVILLRTVLCPVAHRLRRLFADSSQREVLQIIASWCVSVQLPLADAAKIAFWVCAVRQSNRSLPSPSPPQGYRLGTNPVLTRLLEQSCRRVFFHLHFRSSLRSLGKPGRWCAIQQTKSPTSLYAPDHLPSFEGGPQGIFMPTKQLVTLRNAMILAATTMGLIILLVITARFLGGLGGVFE